ncbi:TetR/AcrR family transcriptional regulator [Fundicoccus sp. Sow4_D5]|uniref:TetR/AcrR family transcriptional regulator n=1 Tax=unclassified Fundicoccus TaxID=2761543 RepID=UPI003F90CFBD
MEPSKRDRRVLKSKRAIRQALVKILSNKLLEKITIKEIAEEADVNRKTFYNYYDTPYQVIEEIENDIVSSFDNVLCDLNINEILKNPIHIFEELTSIIQEEFEFYSNLIQAQKVGDINLISKITEALKQRVKLIIPQELFADNFTVDLVISYTISGIMEVYKLWLSDPQDITLKKMAKEMSVLTVSGINGMIAEGKGGESI